MMTQEQLRQRRQIYEEQALNDALLRGMVVGVIVGAAMWTAMIVGIVWRLR